MEILEDLSDALAPLPVRIDGLHRRRHVRARRRVVARSVQAASASADNTHGDEDPQNGPAEAPRGGTSRGRGCRGDLPAPARDELVASVFPVAPVTESIDEDWFQGRIVRIDSCNVTGFLAYLRDI